MQIRMEDNGMNWFKARLIGYGFLLGTAGVKLLTSEEAKKLYTSVTAAGMRAADEVLKTVQDVRESCDDIAADAKSYNEELRKQADERKIREARALIESLEKKEA